jgi:antitoxin ParD1/3/4
MATLTLCIPDDLKTFAQTQAAEAGYSSADDYVQSLIRAASEKYRAKSALEKKILQGLQSPSRIYTAADFARLREELEGEIK